jgi:hypothetical protein
VTPTSPTSQTFTLRYDDDIVRDAANAYILQRAVLEQKTMWVVSVLMVIFSVYLIATGGTVLFTVVMLVLAVVPFAIVGFSRHRHHAEAFGRYRNMREPTVEITIDAAGIDIRSDLGNGRMNWRDIVEIWERPSSFIVFSDEETYIALPRDGMPQEVQSELNSRSAALRKAA